MHSYLTLPNGLPEESALVLYCTAVRGKRCVGYNATAQWRRIAATRCCSRLPLVVGSAEFLNAGDKQWV